MEANKIKPQISYLSAPYSLGIGYKLVLEEDCVWDSGIRGVNWKPENQKGFYIEDGFWYISRGWTWDGATSAPEGPDDPEKEGYPLIWFATLIHDLGCYFLKFKNFPHSRKEVDTFFLIIMLRVKFKWSFIYFFGVRWFGGIFGFLSKTWRKIMKSEPQHDPAFLG